MCSKFHIGIFNSLSDLQNYLDDRLIFLDNNENACVQILHDNYKNELNTKKFLKNNNYTLKEEDLQIIISFPDSTTNKRNLYTFFINTKHNAEKISSRIEDVDRKNIDFEKRYFYILNSNSHFDYYYQWRNEEKVETIGNPSEPCKMINKNTKPF